jgi:uncharacterized protein
MELSNRRELANDLKNVLKTSSLDACASQKVECGLLAWTQKSRRGGHEPMIVPKQGVYYVVFFETLYDSLEDAFSKAPDVIAAHRARSNELHIQGTLLLAGAFLNTSQEKLGSMAVCITREAAEEYVRGDPFVLNGMVSKWSIREWANLFA